MAKTLSNTGIADGSTLFAAQLSQSIEALNGSEDYDITISGSLEVDGPLTLLDLDSATGVSTILVLDGTSVKTQTGGGSGSSGSSGTSGSSGSSGTSGDAGSSGSSGTSGSSGSSGTSVAVDLVANQVTFANSTTTISGSNRLTFDDSFNTLVIESTDGKPGLILKNDDTSLAGGNDFAQLTLQGYYGSGFTDGIVIVGEATGSWGASSKPARLVFKVNNGSGVTEHTTFNADGLIENAALGVNDDTHLVGGGFNNTGATPRKVVSGTTAGALKVIAGGRMMMGKIDGGTLDYSSGERTVTFDSTSQSFWEGSIDNVDGTSDIIIEMSDTITGSYYPGDVFLFGMKIFAATSGPATLKCRYKLNGGTVNETLYDPQGNSVSITGADNNANHVIMGQLTYWKRGTSDWGFFPSSHFIKLQ